MKSNVKLLVPALITFFLGLVMTVIGALFKIQHWPCGSVILSVGIVFETIGILIVTGMLIKIFRS